mgnify:CR=1 FL=1
MSPAGSGKREAGTTGVSGPTTGGEPSTRPSANRIVVLTRWGWTFMTHGRGSRLITGQPLLPDIEQPEPPA